MSVAVLTKREIRERSSQLRTLICEWDPIGVMDDTEWPKDEYDCLIGPLLTLLQSGANDEGIADYLRRELIEHFGLTPADGLASVAQRVRTWFNRGWLVVNEPVTVFVSLLDEGVNVWRPVSARPLGQGLFRLVGVNANVSDERWQFPAGAIVKCVTRQFEDGTTGVVAVEQV